MKRGNRNDKYVDDSKGVLYKLIVSYNETPVPKAAHLMQAKPP